MCWSNQWYGGDLRTFSDLPFIGTPFLVLPPDRIDPPSNSWPFRLSPSFEPVSRSFLIRQVYVCASHFFRLLFWVSPCICICVRVCRRTKGLRRKETARAGCERERERKRELTGGKDVWGGKDARRDVCACKLRIKAYVENIYCPLRMQQNENGNFIIWLLSLACVCVCVCVRVCASVCFPRFFVS